MKKLFTPTIIAALALTTSAHAQNFTGGIAIGGSGTYDSTSMTLSSANAFESGDGTFASIPFSLSSASNTTITGLSGTSTLDLSAPLPIFEISSATTPANEYAFEMTSIAPEATAGNYTGTGEFIDNSGVLTNTAATFTLGFAGGPNTTDGYSFSAAATPEPSSWALGLIALGSVIYLRRRSVRS